MPITRRSVLQLSATGALLTGCSTAGGQARPGAPSAPATATATATAAEPTKPPSLPDQVEHGPRTRPRLALTFHGQGDPAEAEAVLAAAEKGGARVTVLAVGTWLDAFPQLAARVLRGGHELGNHTQTHGDIGAMDEAAASAEITRCAARLRRLTGSQGRWFRPSQARLTTPQVVALAQRAGYPHLLSYDVDTFDYTDPGPAAVRAAVAEQAGPGSVVSLHFGHAGTVAALPGILDDLHRRGLRAVTTSELLT
ncbi:polysaccharide deacetylase family protein [Streptomyces sp. NPDC020983]|uniref:polysaccharide deacetylase family protein n=1 Tax=Streptomyces sp. NPDC020983 TaxID=3365106 RepID=UPI0037A2B8A7